MNTQNINNSVKSSGFHGGNKPPIENDHFKGFPAIPAVNFKRGVLPDPSGPIKAAKTLSLR